jgi:PqqD family protein of HPr-rel-A system
MGDAQPTSEAVLWRVSPAVRWRGWGGEIAAYDEATGDTHHLADLAAWVFGRLAEEAAGIPALAAAASRAIELPPGTVPAAAIGETIGLLHQRRLIEPMKSAGNGP